MSKRLAAAAAAYAAFLVWLGRAATVDYHDGLSALLDGLMLFHAAPASAHFDPQRPPLGWLVTAAPVAFAYARYGAWTALRLSHALMPLWLAAMAALSYALAARVASRPAAAAAALLLACNPLTLQYAPFGLLDIASGALAAVFALQALSWARAPSRRNAALLALAALGAALSKYPLVCLLLGPLAAACFSGRPAKERLRLAAPLALALPAVALAVVLAVSALSAAAAPGFTRAVPVFAAGRLWQDLAFNVWRRPGPSRWLYLVSLWRQLGAAGAAAALAGLCCWLRPREEGGVLAATFAVLLVVLTAVSWKEQRYAIPLLPFAYAALARGLDWAAALLPGTARPAAGVAALAVLVAVCAPWKETSAAVLALREDPAFTTRLPWDLAAALKGASCAQVSGDARWRPAAPLMAFEQVPGFNTSTLPFYAPDVTVEQAPADCPVSVELRPDESGPVARVTAGTAAGRRLVAVLSAAGGGR